MVVIIRYVENLSTLEEFGIMKKRLNLRGESRSKELDVADHSIRNLGKFFYPDEERYVHD